MKLANLCCHDPDELRGELRKTIARLRCRSSPIQSFFRQAQLDTNVRTGGRQAEIDMNTQTVQVAAVQEAPVFLDREKTVEKACELIRTAGEAGAKVVVFPEAFVSGYPDWVWVVPNGNGGVLDELYSELLASAVFHPR